jgi:hypothetical protein
MAQVGVAVAGQGPLFYAVQISSAIVLILAANTSFNGFPSLAATMARDNYLPHQFAHKGLRLVYSNGILVLGGLAIALVVAFQGTTHLLIPLFAVGVFLCFTLSQLGMVRHWMRERGPRWRLKLAINGAGTLTTALVTGIMVVTKFTEGAWLVLLLVPLLALLIFSIHAVYRQEAQQVRPAHYPPEAPAARTVLVPVSNITPAVEETLSCAWALGSDVQALHAAEDAAYAQRLARRWQLWGNPVPLNILACPHQDVVETLRAYVEEVMWADEVGKVVVLLPETITRRHPLLPRQTVQRLKAALNDISGVTVITVTPTVGGAETAQRHGHLRLMGHDSLGGAPARQRGRI